MGDDTGPDEITPEQFLDIFEYNSRRPETLSDTQFIVGLPIIRAWIELRSIGTVTQADLDELMNLFAAPAVARAEGMRLYDLWLHIVLWGQKLGLSVPAQHPWYRS